jgi:transketolase
MQATVKKAINTVRLLSADGVEKANSGHPGMPMGGADFAFVLWNKYLRHDPSQPKWIGRDRFVLSTGHGSMLIYSLLHLFDYGLTTDDLKNFRQLGSKTPGHPEFGHTAGVDVTTGPLGSGFASGIGMAMAAKSLGAKMEAEALFDQRIFTIVGDGCMMEGATSEAASLAGHLKLDNVVAYYDDNSITIEGSTELAFTENVGDRFKAYGWNVMTVDGHDVGQIESALETAIAQTDAPTLIIGKTLIGKGAPNKEGSAKAHGEPLGADELAATKVNLGFSPDESFVVPTDVRELCDARVSELAAEAKVWDAKLAEFKAANPEKAELLSALFSKTIPTDLQAVLMAEIPEKDVATRASAGVFLQKVSELVPSLIGGAADLAPSTKTDVKAESSFQAGNYAGRNLHFGVRELAMGMIGNGMALYGASIPYTSTFFVFSDYMKPAIRLAAIQKLHHVFVFTHDSIYVGEDGPTHQPIEQLAMLRSIPGMTVLRPAESTECAQAWTAAANADGPVALVLTRQNLTTFDAERQAIADVAKGAYVISDDAGYDVMLIATGSEVNLAIESADILRQSGTKVRVVSMPSWELFEAQSAEYKESVIPSASKTRVTIEAGTTFGWERYAGTDGLTIGIDTFGASGPAKEVADHFGLVPNKVADTIKSYLG